MKKRGQFYIIAAIIIIAVLLGIAAYTNYASRKGKGSRIYDLGDELGIETGYVYDYGVFNGAELDSLIDEWTDIYIDYTKEQGVIENWIFIYGDDSGMRASIFLLIEQGSIDVIAGGTATGVTITEIGRVTRDVVAVGEGNEVVVEFKDLKYTFNLEKGENFFFIISTEDSSTTS